MWRLGENLNVKYSLAARLLSGMSGPARMTCMTMDADQLHPPPGDGPPLMSAGTLLVSTTS